MSEEVAERGCGRRKAGGVYACNHLSPHGKPLEHFLFCPPVRVNLSEVGLTAVGMVVFEREGKKHLMDWIGSTYYPYVTDWVEEVRRFGMSARIAPGLCASISLGSRIFPVHAHAWMEDVTPWEKVRVDMKTLGYRFEWCPKDLPEHAAVDERPGGMCSGLWWSDVKEKKRHAPETIERKMPSFTYAAVAKPKARVEYSSAIIGSFPITQIEVINDPIGGLHEQSLEWALKSTLPVKLMDE